jgi:BirA family biotin operon repressor/biotin-[acetyl-CoA-carboxylase] ligase
MVAEPVARTPLDVGRLDGLLTEPGSIWRRIDVVAETGSTNADLIARAAAGEDIAGAVLIAENQTAGRGRNGRTWSAAPQAQIIMSVGVSAVGVPASALGWVPLATGVALVDAIAEIGVPVGLKWPNDVLAGEGGSAGKLAGILAELSRPGPVIVVGFGVNVTMRNEEMASSPGMATSLSLLGVQDPDRHQLISAILRELGGRIEAWQRARGADERLVADYLARSLTIGTRVRALLPGDEEIVGVAQALDAQGRLVLETPGGEVRVAAGDIVHLRPVGGPPPG